ncbi:Armadillo-type fold protein [Niveomyces insectorum RCEF 264]|uniref:Armadillo-type fold protein n=1 Tax=Niveomyces insectorum RCEF 264 TaxID=1081102 RepID=A0A167SEA8_9HYPO|nr:Armadillo-type fold protein [Niveomyces insectorum RCEF 264]
MAAANGHVPPPGLHHQRTKSSVLRSLMLHHRRGNNAATGDNGDHDSVEPSVRPLEETSHNRQPDPLLASRSPVRKPGMPPVAAAAGHGQQRRGGHGGGLENTTPNSPVKHQKTPRNTPTTTASNNNHTATDLSSLPPLPPSPTKKHMRTRSTTNLVGLLSRPKSLKNLHKLASRDVDEDATTHTKPRPEEDQQPQGANNNRGRTQKKGDKHTHKRDQSRLKKEGKNKSLVDGTTPPTSAASDGAANAAPAQVTPIYAQFCSGGSGSSGSSSGGSGSSSQLHMATTAARTDNMAAAVSPNKPRPHSYHPASTHGGGGGSSNSSGSNHSGNRHQTPSAPATPADVSELIMDHATIALHLEALLDRRNIPEHQRYKMRNLANTIKMEFIRQDWAEAQTKRPCSHDSARSASDVAAATVEAAAHASTAESSCSTSTSLSSSASGDQANASQAASKSKHSRVKSLTLSRVARGRSRERGDSNSHKEDNNDNDGGSKGKGARRHKSPGSLLRKRAESTLGRHLRSKSTESLTQTKSAGSQGDNSSTTPSSSGSLTTGSTIAGFFSKGKGPQQQQHSTPGDFVAYLRAVPQPEQVEVGKLHKLRLLLRNETVAWTEDFIGHGGMEEVVGLLHRIMAVEWREEHEDALLHENLLCLKALCTTALALQYLDSIHASLLPALLHMIFDPEKKGPSEFTTRNIVTWVLFTYIQSAAAHERPARAKTVLGYLRDPEKDEEERPVSFVLEMRKDRPYRVWCKEVVSVTKEVFWIFLHHLNIVALPESTAAKAMPTATTTTAPQPSSATTDAAGASRHTDIHHHPLQDLTEDSAADQIAAAAVLPSPPPPPKHAEVASSYMLRHFPQERPPVPAAPYVGGVEWEATNYLASHLDLVNAILACTPTAAERNQLRGQMQMSGWERCMGGSLRLCKEKFYGAVHDGLRTWVAAAYEDGWDVRDVRYGPPSSSTTTAASSEKRATSPKKKAAAAGVDEAAPKLEIPTLDFILDGDSLQEA